ncbi:MAG: SDR family oxidoreductase [Alphaproteobacteria bacterium]|nr:SDR family oxidoreductase [Alphaproteobacteria bacterium]
MMPNLTGQIAVVTAAAQGIGRASAIALAEKGAHVIATDVNERKLLELEGTAGVEIQKLDVRDDVAVKSLFAGLRRVDVLFNCAGYVHNGTVLDCTEEEFDFAYDINVKSMVRTIRAVLPGMLARGGGAIINMASVASSVTGVPSRFAYTTTKAAVIGLTKSIAADFVKQGIRCNAICPGTVETPSLHDRLSAQGDYEKAHAAFVARQPIGRMGTPDEIADLVAYLATATYTTGQIHVIDGGWCL